MNNLKNYLSQALYLIGKANIQISDILPSDWIELHRVMTSDLTAVKGKFKYYNSPYSREIVDCLHQGNDAKIISVMKGAQIGFALDVNELIPTPRGMVKMLDIKVGDYVFDENGKTTKVIKATGVMHGHKCYDVTFTDGTTVRADADHLWYIRDLKNVKRTLNTEFISKKFKVIKKGRDRNRYSVDNPKPIEGEKQTLPIDPYLLGLWLGDGETNGNRITCEKQDLPEYQKELLNRGIKTRSTPYKDLESCFHLHIIDTFNTNKGGVNLYGNKHIPEIYFSASIEQRLSLLQGLIDTDGHVMKDGKVEFYQVNHKLILQVKRLISSLGYKVTIRKRDNTGKLTDFGVGKRYKMQDLYVLNFMGFKELPPAKLSRKYKRLRNKKDIRVDVNKKWICNVVECESVPVKCITVDSPTHLFLTSESYIPTHNSTGVIEAGIAWIIANAPGNILFLVGHADLVKDSGKKLDTLVDNTGIRPLIRSSSKKARNTKTGDTDTMKEYPGGYLKLGITNHKMLRNISMQYGFIDDFDGMKSDTDSDGATTAMIEQRFAAFEQKKKIFYISTPTVKGHSNIEKEFLKGDQRKFHIPCPCCDVPIVWEWEGITYKLDEHSRLIEESVGYTCQECGGFFDDRNKMEMINDGVWIPTATPISPTHRSYHLSALIAPIFMTGWDGYIRQYLQANPIGEKRDEKLHQTFCNLVLGITYELEIENIKAEELQNNIRPYEIGLIPEALSKQDGNGRIILITCGSDLNGTENDARLDYEIVAHSETGATYSIDHGSVGSFIPKDQNPELRKDKMSYVHGVKNSVWPVFEEIIQRIYFRDSDGVGMRIMLTGVDIGYQQSHALQFINSQQKEKVIGLKGDGKSHVGFKKGDDIKQYMKSKSLGRSYNVESNLNKDILQKYMSLSWDKDSDVQPLGFMNFPRPSDGKYMFTNFFSHFEAENKVYEPKTSRYVWKKQDGKQNHLYDCRIYSNVCKDIFLDMYFKYNKIDNGTWADYVQDLKNKRG